MVTAANGNTRNNKTSIIHHFYCFVTSTEVNPRKGNPLQLFVQKLTLCAHSVLHITKDVKKWKYCLSQICPYSICTGLRKLLHVNFYHM